MKIMLAAALMLAASSFCLGSACSDNAKEIRPELSAETLQKYSDNLALAAGNAAAAPTADNIIWYARRKAYVGRYKDAIGALTIALDKFPKDARMYRHRGHRYITLRCFDDAVKDFERAAKLTRGKPDEVEPDGIPNAKGIPTSTLQSNIWYHLGLAYYLKGDFPRALCAYRDAMKVSKNNDMLAATSHWLYMTLRRLNRKGEAAKTLKPFGNDFAVIENADYLKLLRMYRGEIKPETLYADLGEKAATLGNASAGYGLGNWYWYNGDKPRAMEIWRKITAGDQWASFGFIAAEVDSTRQ